MPETKGSTKASTRSCLVSSKALYDYLTFHQFKELKDILCFWFSKQFCKFFVLLLITMIYYFFVFGIYLSIIRNLDISFSGGGMTSARALKLWDILTPKLSDLWKQC